ncbi:type IV pilin-like G/H family protein [Mastigocoleus testarum]|uniref:General secretion pathway protein GspH n=1 Tax=Mastigocoleus testarum BC008 TaxID=371196 RepID=A0A0V7ZVB8_9CYAN|nr:type IV pilin-like G/H family protein [Mastigocoleus testarum]KST68576.1 hypothetical protein BC008_33525 [Mastigocoleus testarum BC008]
MKNQYKSFFFAVLKKQYSSPRFYLTTLLIPVVLGSLWILGNSSSKTCACVPMFKEAQTYLGVMNRAQQALYLEKKLFASSLNELNNLQKLDLISETGHYRYSIQPTKLGTFHYAIPIKKAGRKLPYHTSYIAGVFVSQDSDKRSKTSTIICEVNTPDSHPLPQPKLKNNVPTCPTGTSLVK